MTDDVILTLDGTAHSPCCECEQCVAPECGNCGGELLQVGTSDGFKQDVSQCQACLTIWVERETGAREPILRKDIR